MQSGIVYGYVGLVDGLMDRLIDEMGFSPCDVIATGGLARLIAPLSRTIGNRGSTTSSPSPGSASRTNVTSDAASGRLPEVSLVALALAIALAVSFGSEPVSLAKALSDSTSLDHVIVFEVRLPRVPPRRGRGAGLSVVGSRSGHAPQRARGPFVLGVSGGSAVGATLAILIGVSSASLIPSSRSAAASARRSSASPSRAPREAIAA